MREQCEISHQNARSRIKCEISHFVLCFALCPFHAYDQRSVGLILPQTCGAEEERGVKARRHERDRGPWDSCGDQFHARMAVGGRRAAEER